MLQLPVVFVQSPLQPENVLPAAGIAWSVTETLPKRFQKQDPLVWPAVIVQSIPPSIATTLPDPVPLPTTETTVDARRTSTVMVFGPFMTVQQGTAKTPAVNASAHPNARIAPLLC